MDDCVFCKIASGEIPKDKETYANGEVISFLSIEPVREGHTLVIPKKHYRWFYDLPKEENSIFFNTVNEIANNLKKETGADFIQLGAVGEEVPHVHIHLIPRKFSEGKISLG